MVMNSFLEENPQSAYFSMMPRLRSPLQDYFKNQFGPVQNEYMGALGQQSRSGMLPDLNFTDFLNKYNWQNQYSNQMAGMLSRMSPQFQPRTKWLMY